MQNNVDLTQALKYSCSGWSFALISRAAGLSDGRRPVGEVVLRTRLAIVHSSRVFMGARGFRNFNVRGRTDYGCTSQLFCRFVDDHLDDDLLGFLGQRR
jgi:hypothetical protein